MTYSEEDKTIAFWNEGVGKDRWLVYGKANIYDMCYIAIKYLQLDIDIDSITPDEKKYSNIRSLAKQQAKEWEVGYVD